jgi:hypothetical protein
MQKSGVNSLAVADVASGGYDKKIIEVKDIKKLTHKL